MRVLVSGGAGYIGSVVVDALINAGDEVIVLDNLTHGHRGAVHPAARLAMVDLCPCLWWWRSSWCGET